MFLGFTPHRAAPKASNSTGHEHYKIVLDNEGHPRFSRVLRWISAGRSSQSCRLVGLALGTTSEGSGGCEGRTGLAEAGQSRTALFQPGEQQDPAPSGNWDTSRE